MYVTSMLLIGAENAQTGKELATRLGVSVRDLVDQIARERREGSPICASNDENKGYFLAANREEMQRYCQSLERREAEIRKTREACLAAADNLQ